MKLSEAKKKWGNRNFDAKKFKSGSVRLRAQMADSLIKNKNYIGALLKKVFSDLGSSTGYFFSESIPAYVIQSGGQKPRMSGKLYSFMKRIQKRLKKFLFKKVLLF